MINQDRIAEEFFRLASIESPSFREGEISRYLTCRFQELGGEVIFDRAGEEIGSSSGNMTVRFPGTRQEADPFLLLVHMDTVEPAAGVRPVLEDGVFRSAGETILGADDKAGLAEVIEILEVLREEQVPHPPIEVVVTVCEEVGLMGAKHYDVGQLRSKRGLALDTTGINLVINRAPASNRFRIEIEGRESHAGVAPEKGISAIEVASRAIARMRLGRVDADTTANIGLISGGQATNIVPKRVILDGEVRSHKPARVGEHMQEILTRVEETCREMAKEIDGVHVEPRFFFEVRDDYPMLHLPDDAPLLQLCRTAGEALGRAITVRAAGGGSDANIFAGKGIEMAIMGCGMERVHSVDEFVRVSDMVQVVELMIEILRRA